MCTLEAFKIDLLQLGEGEKTLTLSLDKDYFESIDAPEVHDGKLTTTLSIRKTADVYELQIDTQGEVVVTCDLCLDDMTLPVATHDRLLVKLGAVTNAEDEVVTVDQNEGVLDTSWLVYEFIALAIPIKHVHEPGSCNNAMIDVLEEHSATRSDEAEDRETVDPRWEKLKDLKTKI